MRHYLLFLTIVSLSVSGCGSKIKEQEDSVYSRHLQRHIDLTVITSPMPKNKEDMNLLIFIGSKEMLAQSRAKKIMDSLWKKNLVQPFILVCFSGQENDYGLTEMNNRDAAQYQKLNDFVADELYPFIKKRVVIRKFNSVAVCGFGSAATGAFDIAWNNDEKIQKAGMFCPAFSAAHTRAADSSAVEVISSSRKRPRLDLWITDMENSIATADFKKTMDSKPSVSAQLISSPAKTVSNFADFLMWAFGKR